MVKKIKPWNECDLTGPWEFTIKVDGVRALNDGTKWLSRAGKPLYNLPKSHHTDVEVFCGSFKATIEAVRTHAPVSIAVSCLYPLIPLDPRLNLGCFNNPTSAFIRQTLKEINQQGHEGLVLRQGSKWLKVKPEETFDVPITGFQGGTGKYVGVLGAFLTPMGKVGTGFTDGERGQFWRERNQLLSQMVEVSCMQVTSDGKFRHPRFVRLRPDKA